MIDEKQWHRHAAAFLKGFPGNVRMVSRTIALRL
jgi:hypothetical protein